MSRIAPDESSEAFYVPKQVGLLNATDDEASVESTPSSADEASLDGTDLLGSSKPSIEAECPRVGYGFFKRTIDIVGATVGLVGLSPLMLVCAVIIKLHDGGPILFRQERVGKDGRIFSLVKFRSMVVHADSMKNVLLEQNRHDDNRTFKILNDPRITTVGRFMRRLSLDELPQFWNVLRGEMSLVGPRPALIAEVQLYSEHDRQRLRVKPGLTCFWQVSGRSNLGFEQQMELDLDYIRVRGVWLDLKLILLTVPAVLRGDGAA